MATNYTTNYDLCQWEPTDAVQRVEFNQDNAKVDAALHALEGRNCYVYTTSYTGTGSGGRSFTFPHKPILVIVMGASACWMCAIQGVPFAYLRYSGSGSSTLETTWEGNSMTWAEWNQNPSLSANAETENYILAALLDVEQ